MGEPEEFIKKARTTLGANGSKFVEYVDFLKAYTKDNGTRFESDARNAGYNSGSQALSYYPFFEIRGNLVRRADTQNISHITAAIDRSKPKKRSRKPFQQFGHSNQNRSYSTANYLPKPVPLDRNMFSMPVSLNRHMVSKPVPLNRHIFSKPPGSECTYPMKDRHMQQKSFDTVKAVELPPKPVPFRHPLKKTTFAPTPAPPLVSNLSHPKPFGFFTGTDQSSTLPVRKPLQYQSTQGFLAAPSKSTQTNMFDEDDEMPTVKLGKLPRKPENAVQTPIVKFGSFASEPAKAVVEVPTVKVESLDVKPAKADDDEVPLSNLIMKQAGIIYELVCEIYCAAKTSSMHDDDLNRAIEYRELAGRLTLQSLKCLLMTYFLRNFYFAPANSRFFICSKSHHRLISKERFIYMVMSPRVKQQPIDSVAIVSCEVFQVDHKDGAVLTYLSPKSWKGEYESLVAELRNYASLVDEMTPVEAVFKSEYALYFDEEVKRFYRCNVLSARCKEKTVIYLPDEAYKTEVDVKNLYRMPNRFYKYQEMVFALKLKQDDSAENVKLFTNLLMDYSKQEKAVSVRLLQFAGYHEGVPTYSGKFCIDPK